MLGGLSCGSRQLNRDEIQREIAAVTRKIAPATSDFRLYPVCFSDPIDSVITMFAARERGWVPVLGDNRWSVAHWQELCVKLERIAVPAAAEWATFTSGSTGSPKLLFRTAVSWLASFPVLESELELSAADTFYLPISLLSSMTVSSLVHASSLGAKVVLPAQHTICATELAGATVAHVTPLGLESLLATGSELLKKVLVGGATLPRKIREEAENQGIKVLAYYGSAELSYIASDADGMGLQLFPDVRLQLQPASVQSPFAALQAVTADGKVIWEPAPNGWAPLSDRITVAENGTITVLGRADGAIQTAAATVYPEDVEMVLATYPGVKQVAVFPVPQRRLGETVAACFVAEKEHPLSLRSLKEFVQQHLPRAHWPRQWYFAYRLPLTPSQKLDRNATKELALSGMLERIPTDLSTESVEQNSAGESSSDADKRVGATKNE